jgi:4-hydroxybenzoate polyprenyltransferase
MIGNFLRFIRFSHTIFALPFALAAMFVAADGLPSWRVFGLVVVAMVLARTAAMAFNRLADWEIDQRNPRTEVRHRLVSRPVALLGCTVSAAGFVTVSAALNPLCFALSPVALAVVFFYSLTKRFTHAAQFFLGLALSVAPVGGWLAVTGQFALPPLVLAAAVLCWVAGFDMIYATQDYAVDVREGLHSMVVCLGLPGALRAALWAHGLAWVGFVAFGWVAQLGAVYFVGMGLVAVALGYEHHLARTGDVAAVNRAFFQVNAAVSAIFVGVVLGDLVAMPFGK